MPVRADPAVIVDLASFARAANNIPDSFNGMPVIYDASQVIQSLVSLKLDALAPVLSPDIIAAESFNNTTSAPQLNTFADSKTTTATLMTTATRGYTIGSSATVSVGIPVTGAGASVVPSFSTTLSSSTTQISTTSQTWQWSTQIPVPAHTHVSTSIIVQQAQFSTPYHAVLRFTGTMLWSTNDPRNHYFSSYAVGSFFRTHPHPGVAVIDDSTIEVEATGTFSGVEGINPTVESKETSSKSV